MKTIKILLSTILTISATTLMALPIQGLKKKESGLNKTAAGCNQTTAVIDMDINNVRARLMNGGDMWWDRPNAVAAYEVPKNSNKNALFQGSIWIGGIDRASQDLKVAAQTYRQSGNDYWSGPLDENNGYSINFQTCADWDRFWKINAADITKFREIYQDKTDLGEIQQAIQNNISNVPEVIKEWPAKGNKFIKTSANAPMPEPKRELADYVNVDGIDGYDWRNGDYPSIVGDQYIWWVFNDRGDVKTETTSDAIGLEVHTAAFAFATNDCLNESTFINYKVHNFSTSPMDSTFMATVTDADLGYAYDDYVGCDTTRGLGILYNGDAYDEGPGGYGFELPIVAVDFFIGPRYFDEVKQKDTQLKMTVFTYFNNDNTPTGNPSAKDDYYQYMTGSWKDGQPFTTACNAREAGPATKNIFYGDPCKGGWSEAACANTPYDRRFIHSAGPFPLLPGYQPSNVIIGVVWVPNIGGGKAACFSKIQVCDDKAQNLFDNNFKLPFGPQAPSTNVTPLDRKLVFDIDNLASSNNFGEGYGTNLNDEKFREASPKAKLNGSPDSLYKFEGYIVYQLKDEKVAASDLRQKDGSVNTDRARIVFQCDKKNGIKDIINFEVDPEISTDYYVPKLMVSGQDEGIKHSFAITQDAFATGTSKTLVNYKTYYFLIVAYAYNNFKQFDANNFSGTQDLAYLESRTNGRGLPIQMLSVMPHPANDSLYVQNYADYGTGIQIKRIEGIGNNGVAMELTEESELEALGATSKSYYPTYKPNLGPMDLKVVHPNLVQEGDYEVWVKVDSSKAQPFSITYNNGNETDTTRGAIANRSSWFIVRNNPSGTNDTVYSQVNLTEYNEQYLRKYNSFDWGLSASLTQQVRPGDDQIRNNNGYITSRVLFNDINNQWLSGVQDQDGLSLNNWIRSGGQFEVVTNGTVNNCDMNDINVKDANGEFEKVMSGTWAPYNIVNNVNTDVCGFGVYYGNDSRTRNRLEEVYSIDVVFTSDRSKWSKAAVIEMTSHKTNQAFGENGAFKYVLRKHEGWNGDVDANDKPIYSTNPADSGMSYFPGYAINVETGERLNIAFGEESFNAQDRGNDMLWNPTSRTIDPIDRVLKWGGKHIIYVLRSKYDGCAAFANTIRPNTSNSTDKATVDGYRSVMWVGVPLLAPGAKFASNKDGIIPTDTRMQIRVTRPYTWYKGDPNQTLRNNGWPLYSFTTKGIAPAKLGDTKNNYSNKKDEIFERIHVVPNPYYAYSQYESSRIDNRVRIINLPAKATIKIYTLDGALVRILEKSDPNTSYIDWDIKNSKNIPIASGMYLVHVNLPGVGETVLKWFGAMRPTDLTSF